MIYCITYDLNGNEKDYSGLIQAIKDVGDFARFHFAQSAWLIESSLKSASAVYDSIRPYIDCDDMCLVIKVENDYKGNLETEDIERIEKFIFNEDQ